MFLKNILPVVAVTMVMGLLYAASRKKAKEDGDGNLILQLPKFYFILGILIIVGGIGLLIYGFLFANESDKIIVSICSLLALIAGLFLFAKGYVSNILVTDLAIIETNLFGKQKEIRWNEIKKVSFGKVSKQLKIESANMNIKAHIHLVGFQELVAKLERKTGKTKVEIGIIDL